MKLSVLLLLLFLLFSCKKDEFVYEYPELNKLLVAVTRTDSRFEYRTELKYDNLNRLIEVKNISPESQITIESYVYNEKGDIVEKKVGDFSTTYTYNRSGKLIMQTTYYKSSQDDNEWNNKTEYKYKNGQIVQGVVYSKEGEILQYNNYKYDSRGNTLEKNAYPADADFDFKLVEIKFRYDSKVNPFSKSGVNLLNGFTFTQHPDIKQVNNPVYTSYFSAISSALPPEFEISYEYDPDELPVEAVMNNLHFAEPEPVHVVFEYRDIEE